MAIDFPNSPSVNQTFTVGARTWKYDGEKWALTTSLALDDLSDVVISSPTATQVISYNGSYWTNASASGGASITVSDTPPASPSSGALWYESDTGSLFVYYDSFWVDVSSSAAYDQIIGSIQAKGDLLIGSASQSLSRLAIGADGRRLVAYASATNGACWAPDTNNTVVDAKGDLLVGTSNDTVARLAVGTDGTVLTADSTATGGVSWTTQPPMFRNLIINGAMQVAQRYGTIGVSFGTGGGTMYYGTDRFSTMDYTWSAGSNPTVKQATPSGEGISFPSGFSYAYKASTGATGLTMASGGQFFIRHGIEGVNLAPYYGSTLVMSFWVRSSATGTYTLFMSNNDTAGVGRSVQYEYTINAANTWEKKTITVDMSSATSSGTWLRDNGLGMVIVWVLGTNANRQGNQNVGTWGPFTNYTYNSASSINWCTNANATFYLTGVQLELGTSPSSFEHKPYGVDLFQCQRYFQVITEPKARGVMSANTSLARMGFPLFTPMRIAPVVSYTGTLSIFDGASIGTVTAMGALYSSPEYVEFDTALATGTLTAFRPAIVYDADNTGKFTMNSEL